MSDQRLNFSRNIGLYIGIFSSLRFSKKTLIFRHNSLRSFTLVKNFICQVLRNPTKTNLEVESTFQRNLNVFD